MASEATDVSPSHSDETASDDVPPESEAPALIENVDRESAGAVSVVDNNGDPSEENEQPVATITEGTPDILAPGQVSDSSIGGINNNEKNQNDQSESPDSQQATIRRLHHPL